MSQTSFRPVSLSLEALLGGDYLEAVCAARAALSGEPEEALRALAREKVDFFPDSFQDRLRALLPRIGAAVSPPLTASAGGVGSSAFQKATKKAAAPLSGMGYYRIGEDGRLSLTAKSEHYHVPLGHAFPGYRLIEHARHLGIPNATHNNTRGHITRLLEEALVRCAAGLAPGADSGALFASMEMGCLNRVINLETGSLAMEAAIKLVLSRFYRCQPDAPEPKYAGRTPVLAVIGDDEGGIQANYHGTTVIAQTMRDMWPGLRELHERENFLLVRPVRANDLRGLEELFRIFEQAPYKIAGFFHELVLMNYAGKRLSEEFVRRAYELCAQHDVPPIVDEIQTGIWSPEIFMFREYGVRPAAVALGKGFPGGEYPASRILFSAGLDGLPQFGALVTNGQEELASLAYLITLRWAEANAEATRAVGDYYESGLHALSQAFSRHISEIEGRRHLAGVYFHELDAAKAFCRYVGEAGIDISVQTYKAGCPPSALTKLPLIAGMEVVEVVLARMEAALRQI